MEINVLKSQRNIAQYVIFIACAVAFASFNQTVQADSITLKSAVRLVGDTKAITLADIAAIDGPDAAKFATLPVLTITDTTAAVEINVKDVRNALDKAGVNWGLVNLSGRSVIVRPSRDGSTAPPIAMKPVSISNHAEKPRAEAAQPVSADVIAAQNTIRGEIAKFVVTGLHVDSRSVRLGFDDADTEFLDAARADVRVEIEPQSSLSSDRIAMTLRLWSDARVQSQRAIGIQVRRLVRSAVVLRDLDKDQTITESDLTITEQWLPPSQASMTVTQVQAIGRAAARRLSAGETLRDNCLRRDALVKRGEQVIVRCLVGGVAISMQAEARADGAEGDTIDLRKPGERDTFRATITGRGQAVVDLRAGEMKPVSTIQASTS